MTRDAPVLGNARHAGAARRHGLGRPVLPAHRASFDTGDLVRDRGWWHIAFVDRLRDTFR
ncbi:hypothetical protein [Nocardia sp. NPDC050793]|uniref:hypothetical protein n=1 Tax=Nocardia sp. NPDC050793 TaxID=3155159 RepID=UPI0033FEAECC